MQGRTSLWFALLAWAAVASAALPTPPSSSSSSSYPQLAIHQYFVNTSHAQRQFACSEAERECFKKQRLLHAADGQCYAVGEQGPCGAGEAFHADKAEAARRGGHLRGTCASRCGDAARAPVAATGECLTRAEVEDKICREDLYLRPAKDAFGEWVCEWSALICSRPEVLGGGVFYGDGPYNGICMAPDVFKARPLDGKNVTVLKEKPEDHPLMKYFTNETYREREFPCSEEEAACLRYGRVLGPNGKCYSPGQWSDACEPGQFLHLDLEEATKEGGRLQANCRSACADFRQPQIGTGECVDYPVMSEICRWEWGMSPAQNEFGQMACSCSWNAARGFSPPTLPPPAAPGHCRAPDFSNPVHVHVYDETLTLGFNVPCTAEEHACMQDGRVLAGGACHALRTQGPCADGEQLLLDKDALAHARLEAVCRALPCPVGSVPMPIDGRCLTPEQVQSLVCAGQEVALDEFGGWQCSYSSDAPANFSLVRRDAEAGTCDLPEKYPRFAPVPVGGVAKPDAFASTGAGSGPTAYSGGGGGNFV